MILPVRNEEAYIGRALRAVMSQAYAPLEVIVVDGLSDDGTAAMVREVADADHRVRLLLNEARIAPTAMNIGLAAARGDIVIILGGHSEIAPDYVERCVAALRDTGAMCVGGVLETTGETVTARAIAAVQSSPFGIGPVAFRTGGGGRRAVDTVAFGAYRWEAFERIGGFDERLVRHQDYELNHRLRKAGGEILFDPEIRARYFSRATLGGLWRQYLQYGFWKGRLSRDDRSILTARHLVPPTFVAGLVLGGVAAVVVPPLRIPYVAGVTLYLAAVVAIGLSIAGRRGWRSLPATLAAFPIVHVAWGSGFWRGLLGPRDRRPPQIPTLRRTARDDPDATSTTLH